MLLEMATIDHDGDHIYACAEVASHAVGYEYDDDDCRDVTHLNSS